MSGEREARARMYWQPYLDEIGTVSSRCDPFEDRILFAAAFARREVVDELRRQVADIKTHPFDVELMKHRIEKRISEIESEGV